MAKSKKTLTTSSGAPVDDNQNSLSAGPRGPLVMEDHVLFEKMATFNRERIPERVVHAKGAGAYGTLTVTTDITQYTKAKIFSAVGKTTECFVRFSTVGGESGSADTARDPRGFAIKFYTDEGNWDLVGNNTPVFFIRDPMKFDNFIHSQKRCPQRHVKSPTMMWDYWSLSPESLHQVTMLFSDRGTPQSYRHMNGYGSHTFSLINAEGKRVWVKFHIKTEQGTACFTDAEANRLAGTDPDHSIRDLFDAIEKANFPRWRMHVQIMPEEDAATYYVNPFDLTKVWRHSDYPLIEVATLELNRNPSNYFAEVEQAAFAPSNIVPGIGFSPDKVLQGRILSYTDAQRYRLGVNHESLPVNRPQCPVHTYHRDGAMRYDDNSGNAPNYEPNSFGGPHEDPGYRQPPAPLEGGAVDRYDQRQDGDDFCQAGDLYRVMSAEQQQELIDNIVASMETVPEEIQRRQIGHFTKADADYGGRVADGLGLGGER